MEQLNHPVREAERYLQNARQILSDKAGKDGDYYNDKKYVKLAGHAAWAGVLVALDAVLDIRSNLKKRQRPDFKDYQTAMSKKDIKMLRTLLTAYDLCHKTLGYDGVLNYKIVRDSLEVAESVIKWASINYRED
jgi:hypothetical protein